MGNSLGVGGDASSVGFIGKRWDDSTSNITVCTVGGVSWGWGRITSTNGDSPGVCGSASVGRH